MIDKPVAAQLDFPFATPPATGILIEVAPGVLWTRVPLPFRLDHVNVFLIEDGDGWAVIDTGIDNKATRATWEAMVAGPLAGRRLTRLIVTHYHPDHIGLAGWLCERYGIPMLTSQTSYLGCLNISLSPGALDNPVYRDFYLSHGLHAATTAVVATHGHGYLRMVSPLPPTFERLVAGDILKIGNRDFDVLSGDGHAPEQIMLHCRADKLFLAADQVLARISPNVSVWAVEPRGNPLGLYLRSLRALIADVPDDVLVLPGHQLPFYGLHARARELIAHHAERCGLIADACKSAPKSAAELVPVLFKRELDAHQMSFAFSETLAHVNHMLHKGALAWAEKLDGVERVVSVG
jgi:glyoxylase-like metal-dependent hydrolase (beta-lactamase superfamily II)